MQAQTQPAVITMYTDGSSRGNPGKGGYGVVLIHNGRMKEFNGAFRLTTNNRMELLAVINGLKALKKPGLQVDIYTDSKYVCDSVTKGWLAKWMRTNFAGGKKNSDLWRAYAEVSKAFTIRFHWVKGHADNVYNNRCDVLATQAADNGPYETDFGYEQEDLHR